MAATGDGDKEIALVQPAQHADSQLLTGAKVLKRLPSVRVRMALLSGALQLNKRVDGSRGHSFSTPNARKLTWFGISFSEITDNCGTSRSVKRRTWRRRFGAHSNTG